MELENIVAKIVDKINNKYNTNLVKVENDDCILLPFIDEMYIEIWPMGDSVLWAYFIFGDEEDNISSEDFDSVNDFIAEIVKTIDLYWNKKIKIVTEKKRWHFYKQTRYYLDSENNWQIYDEFDSKYLLVFKPTIKEEILNFSVKN